MPYVVLIVKTLLVCLFAIAVRGTVPRYRFDQATQLNWKHFIYLWFIFLVFTLTYFVIFI